MGHEGARSVLEAGLPPISLFRGPASVGKRMLAESVVRHHGAQAVDVRVYQHLTVEASREIRRFLATTPFGPFKAVISRLDRASEPALNSLLKILEEPPPTARFLLTSSSRVLDTIASRSFVFSLGLLSVDQVEEVLALVGVPERSRAKAARMARGQVAPALAYAGAGQSRPRGGRGPVSESEVVAGVEGVLKAVATGDVALFELATGSWEAAHHEALTAWCREALTGRWARFSPGSVPVTLQGSSGGVGRVLVALGGLGSGASPRLAVRAVLGPLVEAAGR